LAGSDQWGRAATIEIGDIKIQQVPFQRCMRFSFSVSRDKTEFPNTAEVQIWGLSQATRERLERQNELNCRIMAGYRDNAAQIFYGQVQDAHTVRDGADRILRLSLGEGENEFMTKEVDLSFPKGTSLKTALVQLITATGQGLGNANQLSKLTLLASGADKLESAYVAHGSAVFELQVFCDAVGLDWSFQDGQFMGAAAGEPYRADGPLIAPHSGLVEVKLDRRGNVEGKSLLLPDLIPGVGFRVESDSVTGAFITSATVHEGDNYDEGRWHVTFHGLPYGATSDGLMPEKKKKK
jgi:hypothetical protein